MNWEHENEFPPPLRGRVREGGKRASVSHARKLRKTPTVAERRLWKQLRRNHLAGFGFRRQQPIGPYVVDFFCPSARLIIELDGPVHKLFGAAERDAIRMEWLQARGYRVLRFENDRVLEDIELVLEAVSRAVAAPPSLTLPLKGGGEWIASLSLPPAGGGD